MEKSTGRTDESKPLAERGTRLAAVLIDSLILLITVAPGLALLKLRDMERERLWLEERIPFDPQAPWHILDISGVSLLVIGLAGLLIIQLYLLTSAGQTIGKRFFGVRIVRHKDGRIAGFLHVVVLRYLILKPIWIIPILGQLFAITDALFIFGDKRRCIHDLVAGTKVVVADESE